jgi:hypothetical protein
MAVENEGSHEGDSTKRTISKSEALLDFAVLMTEEKVA